MSNDTTKVAYYPWCKLAGSDKQCLDSGLFTKSDAARFWSKVTPSGGCWLWQASLFGSLGYGQFTVMTVGGTSRKQRHLYAHRVAWELANGQIPAGQHVLHACDVPACVNPAHLFLGTQQTNMEDAASKGRLHVGRPKRQKVSDAAVSQIRAAVASGAKQIDLANMHGVSKALISRIVNGHARQYQASERGLSRMVASR